MKDACASTKAWRVSLFFLLTFLIVGSASGQGGSPRVVWQDQITNQFISTQVRSVAFSPDGQIFATGIADRTVRLWRADNGAFIRSFTQRQGGVNAIAFSPDGQMLAVGTDATNQNLNLWQVATGTLIAGRITAHQNGTKSVAFSPDGSRLVTVGPDHTTKMWRVPDMGLMMTMVDGPNDTFRVFSVAFSPDGQLIASATNKIVHIWRASDGALLRTLNGSFPVAFSPDSSTLVSASPEHALKFWSVPSGVLLRSISRPTETIMSLTFSRDGQFVLASGYVTFTARDGTMQSSGMIRFFRAGDGSLFQAYDRGLDIAVLAIAISPDGRLFGYGLYGGGFAVARSPF